ncbi:MAG: T9SS type A sorting domain-containing protein [Flavobacteriales bacterium]|nr:T9SS type A sorting domain-containing protein [Flavobacteriales bacterium]
MSMRSVLTLLTCAIASAASAITVQCWSYPEICGYGNGQVGASTSGGTPPYTYAWDNGGVGAQLTGLQPGDYTVTVTDDLGAQATCTATVTASPNLTVYYGYSTPTCPGTCTGTVEYDKTLFGGVAPYTYSVQPGGEDANNIYYSGVCWFAEGNMLTVTDNNGCSGEVQLGVANSYYSQVVIEQIMPSCQGVAGYVAFQLDFVMLTLLRVYDAQMNVVYEDPAPPSGTVVVDDLAPGDYTIRCISNEIPGEWCYGETPFTIPDLGTDCGRVMGRLFIDQDSDCFFDQPDQETAMPYRVLVVEPGPVYGITDADGEYVINLNEGSYTIENQDADLFPLCPAIEPAPFDITALAPVVIQDLADSSSVAPDLSLSCVHSDARPGFVYHVWLTIANNSPYFAGSPNLLFTHDPLLTFISSSYPLYTVSPGQVQWPAMYFLPGFGTRTIHLQFQVPADVGLIGTQISSTGSTQQNPPEADASNNSCSETITITGSYDPNDKTAFTSTRQSDELYFIDEDEWIDYRIRFQNTGTASAINVEVSDTLPAVLDPSTMQLQGWSHQLTRVQITEGPVMHWYFDNINLPDSGANEPASHGFVSFRIKPHEPLMPGTVIKNNANIYFDFNPPVITEPSVLVAEFSTGVQGQAQEQEAIRLMPNPVNDELRISANSSIASLRIIAADGREVIARSVRATNSIIAVDRLQAGAYLLIGTFTDGTEARERFIKQ